jgi:hypothetical protein
MGSASGGNVDWRHRGNDANDPRRTLVAPAKGKEGPDRPGSFSILRFSSRIEVAIGVAGYSAAERLAELPAISLIADIS